MEKEAVTGAHQLPAQPPFSDDSLRKSGRRVAALGVALSLEPKRTVSSGSAEWVGAGDLGVTTLRKIRYPVGFCTSQPNGPSSISSSIFFWRALPVSILLLLRKLARNA